MTDMEIQTLAGMGRLASAESGEHARSCGKCRRDLVRYRLLGALLKGTAVSPGLPADFSSTLRHRIDRLDRRRKRWTAAALAVAGTGCIGITAALVQSRLIQPFSAWLQALGLWGIGFIQPFKGVAHVFYPTMEPFVFWLLWSAVVLFTSLLVDAAIVRIRQVLVEKMR